MKQIKTVRINEQWPIPAKEEPDYETPNNYDVSFVNFLILRLSEFERSVVVLYFYENKSDEQISRILKINKDSIYYTRKTSLKKLNLLYQIYNSLTPSSALCQELNPEEQQILLKLYHTLKKPTYHTKLKTIISKIQSIEKRKIFNLIYNYSKMFVQREERKLQECLHA